MRRRYPPRGRVEEPYKVNGRITATEVRVVGENVEQGVFLSVRPLRWPEQKD